VYFRVFFKEREKGIFRFLSCFQGVRVSDLWPLD
jgi:hypothetical protein